MRHLIGLLCLLTTVSALAGAGPSFSKPPTVAKEGDTVTVRFALDRPTDVAVAVENAKGEVVRHLVAGKIGGGAKPPAPLNPGLEQELTWDGKTDDGKPAAGGPFKVRVRLGLRPTFDSFLLHNPDGSPRIHTVAVGPKGRIYCFYKDPTANGNQGGLKIAIRDRGGRHVRQIMPFPADIDHERVEATGCFRDGDGRLVPQLHNWHTLNYYPDPVLARHRSTSTFGLPVVDSTGRLYWILSNRLVALEPDGGIPYDDFLGPSVTEGLEGAHMYRPSLAISADDKTVYLSGMGKDRKRDPKNRRQYIYTGLPAVLRIDTETRKAEVFVGDPSKPGAEKGLLTQPRGLDVANGLVYVADPGADRIVVYKEDDRSFVGEVKLKSPQTVDVNPETGAIYVCVYTGAQNADLVKLSGYENGKELYRMTLPKTGLSPNLGTHRIVGDFSGERPRFWMPGLPYGRGKGTPRWLNAYEDTGETIGLVKLNLRDGRWANGPRDLLVDRKRDELYVKVSGERWWQIDDDSGKVERLVRFPKNAGGPYMGAHGANLGVSSDGNYITHCWGKGRGLMRWTRDLRPLNWEGKKTHRTKWGGMMTFQLNYMTVHDDLMYIILRETPYHVRVMDMGLNRKRIAVHNVSKGSIPRVDAEGNIYLATKIKPPDRDLPAFFDDKLGKTPDYYRNIGAGHYWYVYMYGSVVKFPPSGGAFVWSGQTPSALKSAPDELLEKPAKKFRDFVKGRYPHRTGQVIGAEWTRFGFCPHSETYPAGTPVCMCEGAGFDVDPFGRVFYPNLGRFRVEIVDTNNNPVTTFGHYGNRDSGSTRPNEEGEEEVIVDGPDDIPLAWPTYVAVSDDYAYVNDTIGMRVVKVKLDYAAEATAEIE
ncbi:MAG: FlgD immunoglobulin-like domain containing protein [Planctomycetota bacterium]